MARRLLAAWRERGPLARLLWPLSQVYRAAWTLRKAAFRIGLLKVEHLPVPVVVVGNVIAGGAGKTPVVIALVEHLAARGIAAGVVSRGYGRLRREGDDDRGFEVPVDADPRAVGDEPLLIRQRTGVPVFVGRDRSSAAQRLLTRHPEIRVVVCDDGLQHLALGRDIEICVFDDRGTGNGWMLPAGPLREPWPRATDMVLHTGRKAVFSGFGGERQLAVAAVGADGLSVPLDALALQAAPLVAIAGIAEPEGFFDMLRDCGLALTATHALPDHADFESSTPVRALISTIDPATTVLCTEKDAAKLWRLLPAALAVPLRFVPDPDFLAYFDRLVDARLSSPARQHRQASRA
jgi:tetraacyldisaccharide 4'-kinase